MKTRRVNVTVNAPPVWVETPEAFAGEDLAELRRELGTDPRLAAAAEAARSDGKVIQVLAGGPEFVQRYEHPADADDRYGKAVVTAAMDIRRLGHESPIGRALLDEVAPVSLDPPDCADAPVGWFGTGLADATDKMYGISALTARRDQPDAGPADGYVLQRLPGSVCSRDASRRPGTCCGVGRPGRAHGYAGRPHPARTSSTTTRPVPPGSDH